MFNEIPTRITPNTVISTPISTSARSDSGKYYVTRDFVLEDNGKDSLTVAEQTKERKTKKLGAKIVISALGLGFGVLALMRGMPKGIGKNLENLTKILTYRGSELVRQSKQKWSSLLALSFVKKASNLVKGSFNVTSFKDVLFAKAVQKTKVLMKPAKWITKVFDNFSRKTVSKSYHRAAVKYNNLFDIFETASSKLSQKQSAEVAKKVKSARRIYAKNFGDISKGQRLNKVKAEMGNLQQQVWDKTCGRLRNFVSDKNSYTTFIAEDLVASQKTGNMNLLNGLKDKMVKGEITDIMKIFKEVLSPTEYSKLEKTVSNANRSLAKSIDIEGNKYFDKLRDLVVGSAPTDVLSVITALGAVGFGLAKADNSEERISAALRYGIPVIGSVATSLVCTAGLISGGLSLAIGLLSGALIGQIGSGVDKAFKKAKNTDISKLKPSNVIADVSNVIK